MPDDDQTDYRAIREGRAPGAAPGYVDPGTSNINKGLGALIAARNKKKPAPGPSPSPSPAPTDTDTDVQAAGRRKAVDRM